MPKCPKHQSMKSVPNVPCYRQSSFYSKLWCRSAGMGSYYYNFLWKTENGFSDYPLWQNACIILNGDILCSPFRCSSCCGTRLTQRWLFQRYRVRPEDTVSSSITASCEHSDHTNGWLERWALHVFFLSEWYNLIDCTSDCLSGYLAQCCCVWLIISTSWKWRVVNL